jgi:hypothetical protein
MSQIYDTAWRLGRPCCGGVSRRRDAAAMVRTGAQPANGANLSPMQGPAGGRKGFRGMVFFVVRRNQNRKVEVTAGDIFASRPGIAAGQRTTPPPGRVGGTPPGGTGLRPVDRHAVLGNGLLPKTVPAALPPVVMFGGADRAAVRGRRIPRDSRGWRPMPDARPVRGERSENVRRPRPLLSALHDRAVQVRVGSKRTPCASRTVQSRVQSWRLRAAHCSKTTSV